jgi:ATP-dependent Clp protease ATP-binding subunit ClpA
MGAVRKHFLPEFLNRISSTVIFNRLAKGEIRKLVDLRLGEIQRRLQQNSRDITIKCSKQVKEHIGQSSYSAEYGARPITRTIENEVLNPMVKLILHGHISNGDRAQLVMRDGQIDVLAVRRDVRTKSNRARASPEKI